MFLILYGSPGQSHPNMYCYIWEGKECFYIDFFPTISLIHSGFSNPMVNKDLNNLNYLMTNHNDFQIRTETDNNQ